ncbi:hypothetical protein [uncultured Chryseobacterium sp.]|uniref:hypothetical protein n=1 Tax=uncultured Chryseobacterium sp. TaxID=259322 RepID=UPI00258E0E8D|nr:hypothetical protein [uncultured Chryseobacterium sp.]
MNISELILQKIETDKVFRLELASKIDLSERQIQNLVDNHRKGKSVRLRDALAVDYYKSRGFSKKEIYTN